MFRLIANQNSSGEEVLIELGGLPDIGLLGRMGKRRSQREALFVLLVVFSRGLGCPDVVVPGTTLFTHKPISNEVLSIAKILGDAGVAQDGVLAVGLAGLLEIEGVGDAGHGDDGDDGDGDDDGEHFVSSFFVDPPSGIVTLSPYRFPRVSGISV